MSTRPLHAGENTNALVRRLRTWHFSAHAVARSFATVTPKASDGLVVYQKLHPQVDGWVDRAGLERFIGLRLGAHDYAPVLEAGARGASDTTALARDTSEGWVQQCARGRFLCERLDGAGTQVRVFRAILVADLTARSLLIRGQVKVISDFVARALRDLQRLRLA